MRQANNAALVMEHRPYVRRIAKSFKRKMPRADLEDLEQAGMVGLIEAAARFRGENGAILKTFAGHRIFGAMLDSLRESDWTPRSVNRAGRDIAQAIRDIEIAEQRPAREVEIAERLGLSIEDYRRALTDTKNHHVLSFDEAPAAMNAESCSRPDDEAEQGQIDARLRKAIAALPERERYIVERTFCDGATLCEVGAELGVTESRICQLRSQAVARLRAKLDPR